MALIMNELGELYDPADFEPRRGMRLRSDPIPRERREQGSKTYGRAACAVCGAEFTRRSTSQLYCSQPCSTEAYNERRRERRKEAADV